MSFHVDLLAVPDQFRFSVHVQYEEARDTIESHEGESLVEYLNKRIFQFPRILK